MIWLENTYTDIHMNAYTDHAPAERRRLFIL